MVDVSMASKPRERTMESSIRGWARRRWSRGENRDDVLSGTLPRMDDR